MKTEIKPVWNVYDYSHNDNEMRVFNVFNHSSFNHNVEKILKQDTTKEEFSELLRRQVQYYYWSKAEWECVITDLNPHIAQRDLERILNECYLKKTNADRLCRYTHVNLSDAEKIDVYDQLRLNWEEFVEYVWSFKKKPRVRKKPITLD